MAFDYTEIIQTASELIAEFGRTVTFVALNNVPDDGAKPWLRTTSPRTAPVATLSVSAVFVEPSTLNELGRNDTADDFVKRSTQIALVYTDTDLRTFEEVLDDDGSRWRVQGLSQLRPGASTVLWYVGVSR